MSAVFEYELGCYFSLYNFQEHYECKLCKKSMAGVIPAEAHLKGSQHSKAVRSHRQGREVTALSSAPVSSTVVLEGARISSAEYSDSHGKNFSYGSAVVTPHLFLYIYFLPSYNVYSLSKILHMIQYFLCKYGLDTYLSFEYVFVSLYLLSYVSS